LFQHTFPPILAEASVHNISIAVVITDQRMENDYLCTACISHNHRRTIGLLFLITHFFIIVADIIGVKRLKQAKKEIRHLLLVSPLYIFSFLLLLSYLLLNDIQLFIKNLVNGLFYFLTGHLF